MSENSSANFNNSFGNPTEAEGFDIAEEVAEGVLNEAAGGEVEVAEGVLEEAAGGEVEVAEGVLEEATGGEAEVAEGVLEEATGGKAEVAEGELEEATETFDDTGEVTDEVTDEVADGTDRALVEVAEDVFDEESDVHEGDTAIDKRLRKLNKKYKSKAEKAAERAALSEMEFEGYVPEEHESVYDISVDKKVYSNNYAMSAFLILFGFIVFPYSKTATALLVFYGIGVAWMAYKGIKTKLHVDGTTFTVEGNKYPGTYTFDQVEKIIYVYNKRDQRRYTIHADGKKLCEIPPGAIHSRWLYDDMIAYGVPGGWYNKL